MSEVKLEAATEYLLNLSSIQQAFSALATINGWQEYHNPKNLAAAVAVESAELLAEFQWLTPEEAIKLGLEQKQRVADEVADVIMYVTELCKQLDINMVSAVQQKIEKNRERFRR